LTIIILGGVWLLHWGWGKLRITELLAITVLCRHVINWLSAVVIGLIVLLTEHCLLPP
jgi:hypothetical protein